MYSTYITYCKHFRLFVSNNAYQRPILGSNYLSYIILHKSFLSNEYYQYLCAVLNNNGIGYVGQMDPCFYEDAFQLPVSSWYLELLQNTNIFS